MIAPFLIQTIDRKVIHDFSFHLILAINYNNWYYNDSNYLRYVLDYEHDINDQHYIPVGTVEFVSDYFTDMFGHQLKPKNIPICLLDAKFTKRKVFNGDINQIFKDKPHKFIKSNTKIKTFVGTVYKDDEIKQDNYQISDIISIESEYRCFIFEDKLRWLVNYSDNFELFPDINIINDMIQCYQKNQAPIAYTLDIGLNSDVGTFIIEVHDFFSCGLYGFQDYSILPYMFSRWYFEEIKNNNLIMRK
jgi:hypothetical protein